MERGKRGSNANQDEQWLDDRVQKKRSYYYHSLKASKDGQTFDVPCEDTPSNFVGIWTYQLSLSATELIDLFAGLREWANQSGLKYRLYNTREDYESSDGV